MPIKTSIQNPNPIYTISTLRTPITLPPIPQVDADAIWICTLGLNLNEGPSVPGNLTISFAPCISSTGEVIKDQIVNYTIPDPMGAAGTNSDLATLFDNINTLVVNYCSENGIFGMS